MTGFSWACDPVVDTPEGRAKARAAEAAIRQVYDDNNCRALDFETEVDTAVMGDGCYKVLWDTAEKRVRITAPDAGGLYAWRRPDDYNQVYQVATRYQLTGDEAAQLYRREPANLTAWVTELWTAGYVSGHLFWGTEWRKGEGRAYSLLAPGRGRGRLRVKGD
jgi:hypothetical protein